jgi:hypothetical protein
VITKSDTGQYLVCALQCTFRRFLFLAQGSQIWKQASSLVQLLQIH